MMTVDPHLSESNFCDKTVFVLAKNEQEKSSFKQEFANFGVETKQIDITNINIQVNKKYLLLVRKELLPHLEPEVYISKLQPNHYIYSYSEEEISVALEGETDSEDQTEGHFLLPIGRNEIFGMFKMCHQKSHYENSITNLEHIVKNLETISALGNYTGSLIHDLNNFNTVCMTAFDALKMLNDRKLKNDQVEFLIGKGLKGTHMMNTLTGKYRKFLKSADQITVQFLTLENIINSALEFLESPLKRINATVKVEISPYIQVLGDELALMQIVMNLLNNAIYEIKSLDEKWISIKIRFKNEKMSLIVVDSGTGIPVELRDKIFDPLFSTKPGDEGSGFGLSFCQKEAHKMGMKLKYLNAKNTAFGIEIPHDKYKIIKE